MVAQVPTGRGTSGCIQVYVMGDKDEIERYLNFSDLKKKRAENEVTFSPSGFGTHRSEGCVSSLSTAWHGRKNVDSCWVTVHGWTARAAGDRGMSRLELEVFTLEKV